MDKVRIDIKEINTALEPFDIYSVFKDEEETAFLDSGKDPEKLGRYSIIGLNPFLKLKGRSKQYTLNDVQYEGDMFEKLSELIKRYECCNNTELPLTGGCIGYFSYDFGLTLDEIVESAREDIVLPHYYFIFYDNLIICDNREKKTFITSCGMLKNREKAIHELAERISVAGKVIYPPVTGVQRNFISNFTPEEYMRTVGKVREYIRNGDIYIANLTQRFTATTEKSSYDIYRDLRHINPAPFAAFLNLDNFDIISSSPERFLRIHRSRVETRPIKGTRPRGKTMEEDEFFRNELLNSEKDRAELLMIVDLERNDLSKVCKPNSVKVTELFKLEEYSTVFHLVSNVEGYLKEGVDAVKCLKACFPGGSITGTPKIRAMEIIDELEGIKRNIYTGCIGYFGFDGSADFNIVIRTILKQDEKVYFGVGGGITWDSDEAAEYEETMDKAKALMRVIY